MKKNYFFIIIAIILILIIFLVYYFLDKKDNIEYNKDLTILPEILIKQKVFFPAINLDKILFLSDKDHNSTLTSLNIKDNQLLKITNEEILDVKSIFYSNDAKYCLINYNDNLVSKFYNLEKNNSKIINLNIINAIWNKKNTNVAYCSEKNNTFSFFIANNEFENYKNILNLEKNKEEERVLLTGYSQLAIFYLNNKEDNTKFNLYSYDFKYNKSKTIQNNIIEYIHNEDKIIYKISDKQDKIYIFDYKDQKISEYSTKNNINLTGGIIINNDQIVIPAKNSNYISYLMIYDFSKDNIQNIIINNTSEESKYALKFLFKNLMLSSDKKYIFFTANDFLYKIYISK